MSRDDEQTREARRILERISAESDGAAMKVVSRTAARGRDHFGAADADESDWVEVWGTRIGRAISLILLLGAILYLVLYLFRG
ncbi:hypothetical protein ACFOEZ_13735 [Tianweitania populi]|uniref:Uncharacterized protein n=1 Tax=Tianweitania populi TaxID=1607949 RepID=A0A8J3DXZ2_9HYPH|nr:hypothetical protein [Tianweitania populi]GHD17783.1 hypothetical protein GCM10016234_27330 [Tianweitania populi]